MVQHNQSFKSMKCTSEIVRIVCDQKKFSCSETKASAIVSGVFEPMILAQIKSELEEAYFVSISTDASNHKNVKMFPVIVRFFSPDHGIKVRLIEFTSLPAEDGLSIFNMVKETFEKWGFGHKIICFCGDNCATNFGKVDRTNGDKNVFTRLQEDLGPNLIGMGCLAHILHNTPQNACLAVLPFDIQNILVLMYKRFYISTKQTEILKKFCEELDIEFANLKGCPKTRFLAKKNSIKSVLKVFGALEEYFTANSSTKVARVLLNFFEDPLRKFYLIIVRDICEMFEEAILMIEGNDISGYEAIKVVKNIQMKLQGCIDESFMSIEAERELVNIRKFDPNFDETAPFDDIVRPIYGKQQIHV